MSTPTPRPTVPAARRPVRRSLPLASALLGATFLAGAGCVLPEERPFDAIATQKAYRDRAAENQNRDMPPVPKELDRTFLVRRAGGASPRTTQPTAAVSGGPAVRLSLKELIQLAAANSLDVKVAGYQPAIDEARTIEAEARFDMSYFSNFNFQNQWVLSPSPQFSGNNANFETLSWQTGLKQPLITGGQVQFQYAFTRTFRAPSQSLSGATFDRIYESGLSLQLQQPLLQNFGVAVNRARIDVARNTQRVSLLDFRLALEKQLTEIEGFYWQLQQAEQDLRIQERLFQETVTLTEHLQTRFDLDVDREVLGQSNAQLRSREQSLIDARDRLRKLSNEIKVRVNDPDLPLTSNLLILAEDKPVDVAIQFDLPEQVETALRNRAELAQQRVRIESATIVTNAAKNNMLPRMDLVFSVGIKGADNDWGPSLKSSDQTEWGIGVQFEFPLGNREARAIWRRTQLQRMQSVDQYRLLIEQVVQQVKDSYDDVTSAWLRVSQGTQSVLAAQEYLKALQARLEVGQRKLDAEFVNRLLGGQEQLAAAARELARAKADYNIAIATLERAKGTILKYDNVLMAEDPDPVRGPDVFPIPSLDGK